MPHTLYLALGSNLGERRANLRTALEQLAPEIRVVLASSIYETAPWGYTDQPSFLNQVARAETDLTPLEALLHLKGIEAAMGRQPTFRYGPRLIDLDILFYDDLVLDDPALQIPHPHVAERAFVLVPLAQIAPELRHPVTAKNVLDMMLALDCSSVEAYPEAG